MSIISEALKKAQKTRSVGTRAPAPVGAISVPQGSPSTERYPDAPLIRSFLPHALTFAGAVAAILIVLFVIVRFFSPGPAAIVVQENASVRGRGEHPTGARPREAPPAQAETYKPVFPALRQTPMTSYNDTVPVLNGIMYLPTAPRAVINGRTVKEGDMVEGHTVIRILPDRVRLSSEKGVSELELR